MSEKSKRGFAAMDPARQKEIASKGGRAAHAKGAAHEWSREEAREAGHKGGVVVSRDREHMSTIGLRGGEARSRLTAQMRTDAQAAMPRRFVERSAELAQSHEVVVELAPAPRGRDQRVDAELRPTRPTD